MFKFPINIIGKIMENIYFKIYREYDFWTVSESTASELKQRGISEEKISIIKSVVEINQKPNVKKEKNPTYVFISRLVKMKGIEDVINAFFLIYQKQPMAVLWIIGTGDSKYVNYLKYIVNLKELTGRVKFWGYLPEQEKLCLLSKAHILLHASVKEGFSCNGGRKHRNTIRCI
jgi:glycosyltransferase involved in cell wall biosynthesis